jgi:hypothetical protein
MKTRKNIIALILLALINFPLFAGWVITTEISEELDKKETETTFIQNNKIKSVTEKEILIFDLNTEEIIFCNPVSKIYWSGTLSEFKNTMIEEINIQMESTLDKVPAEYRDEYKKKFQEMIEKIENSDQNKDSGIEAKSIDETIRINNYEAEKYQLWKDNILREEIWVAPELSMKDDLDIGKFKNFFHKFLNTLNNNSVENTPEFIELFEKGYPLKTIEYHENFKIINTVVNIENKNIPDAEFDIPEKYKKAGLSELWED